MLFNRRELACFRPDITATTGAVSGSVSDSTKALVPGVTAKAFTSASASPQSSISGVSPILDISSTAAATHFDAGKLASLPGARDIFAVLANTPGILDVYNMLNTNAAQTLTTTSGSFWLRPTAIAGPRVLRIGARLEW